MYKPQISFVSIKKIEIIVGNGLNWGKWKMFVVLKIVTHIVFAMICAIQ